MIEPRSRATKLMSANCYDYRSYKLEYRTVGRAVPVPGLAGLLLLSAATTDRQARRSTDILPPVRSAPDTVLNPERSSRQSLLPPPRGLGVANIVRITSENSAKLIGCSKGCTYFTASTRKYTVCCIHNR
jgi:hypothetical protein